MTGVLVQPTLVLNSSFLPISVVRAMVAICLFVTSKADLIDGDEAEQIRSQRLSIPLPRVVRLLHFNGIPSNPAWSRLKVIYRDDMTCAWCGKQGRMEELDCDHVIPRSRWYACPQNFRKPYEVPHWDQADDRTRVRPRAEIMGIPGVPDGSAISPDESAGVAETGAGGETDVGDRRRNARGGADQSGPACGADGVGGGR